MKVLAWSTLLAAFSLTATAGAADQPLGSEWTPLLNGRDLADWHTQDGKPLEWFTTRAATAPPGGKRLEAERAPGGILVNGPKGRTSNLVTDRKFGDVELHVEFLVPAGSNSGVYLQGLYEIQIKDSFGVASATVHDCGAVYERWINSKGVGGAPPARNACRPAGEWQAFDIWFQAPRFDASGRKAANAKFLRVVHN
ncbi:MAG: 3-keto-disaccharide hydrolase, partial [Terriglobia bacterium]